MYAVDFQYGDQKESGWLFCKNADKNYCYFFSTDVSWIIDLQSASVTKSHKNERLHIKGSLGLGPSEISDIITGHGLTDLQDSFGQIRMPDYRLLKGKFLVEDNSTKFFFLDYDNGVYQHWCDEGLGKFRDGTYFHLDARGACLRRDDISLNELFQQQLPF